MPTPLDPATLPRKVIALRSLLLQREAEHEAEQQQQIAELERQAAEIERQAAELTAARNGLQEQVLRNEQLKQRLARLLRERFGASSEKLRGAIEQLELLLGDLEEQIARPHRLNPNHRLRRSRLNQSGVSRHASRCRKTCRATWWNIPPRAPARNAAARCTRWARM